MSLHESVLDRMGALLKGRASSVQSFILNPLKAENEKFLSLKFKGNVEKSFGEFNSSNGISLEPVNTL